jgi:hypothetical protein
MTADLGIEQLSLTIVALVSGFTLGILSGAIKDWLARHARRKAVESGPVTVKVKGIKDPIVIPEHYNSAAIDKLLRQLEINV